MNLDDLDEGMTDYEKDLKKQIRDEVMRMAHESAEQMSHEFLTISPFDMVVKASESFIKSDTSLAPRFQLMRAILLLGSSVREQRKKIGPSQMDRIALLSQEATVQALKDILAVGHIPEKATYVYVSPTMDIDADNKESDDRILN